jgi:hypothetical protein
MANCKVCFPSHVNASSTCPQCRESQRPSGCRRESQRRARDGGRTHQLHERVIWNRYVLPWLDLARRGVKGFLNVGHELLHTMNGQWLHSRATRTHEDARTARPNTSACSHARMHTRARTQASLTRTQRHRECTHSAAGGTAVLVGRARACARTCTCARGCAVARSLISTQQPGTAMHSLPS